MREFEKSELFRHKCHICGSLNKRMIPVVYNRKNSAIGEVLYTTKELKHASLWLSAGCEINRTKMLCNQCLPTYRVSALWNLRPR